MSIRSRAADLWDWLVDFYNKFFIAYTVVAVCVIAALFMTCAPIWPFGYYTAVWILAFFFPASAVIYSLFNLRVRFNEIRIISEENCYHLVYFPSDCHHQCSRKFARYLRRRFAEYYNLYELAVFSLIAGMLVLGAGILLTSQFSPPDEIEPLVIRAVPVWVVTFGSGFLGALAGGMSLFTRDTAPSTSTRRPISR